jgi:hypothetical protein
MPAIATIRAENCLVSSGQDEEKGRSWVSGPLLGLQPKSTLATYQCGLGCCTLPPGYSTTSVFIFHHISRTSGLPLASSGPRCGNWHNSSTLDRSRVRISQAKSRSRSDQVQVQVQVQVTQRQPTAPLVMRVPKFNMFLRWDSGRRPWPVAMHHSPTVHHHTLCCISRLTFLPVSLFLLLLIFFSRRSQPSSRR